MTKRLVLSLALLVCLALGMQAVAQYAGGMGQQGGGWGGQDRRGGGAMADPDTRLQRMSQQLNLTDDQKEKIKPILQDEAKQMQSVRDDSSISQQDRRAKFQEIRQNTMKQIRPLLNADQQKQLDEMAKQRGGKEGHGGWQHGQPNPQ